MSDVERNGETGLHTVAPGKVISDEAWTNATSRWLNGFMRNSAVSGNTDAWNHLNGSMHELRTLLEEEIQKT